MLYPHLEGRRVVLASQSPRRRELMGMLGLEVECMARDVDESWPQELEGVGVAEYVARKKAAAYLDVLGPERCPHHWRHGGGLAWEGLGKAHRRGPCL